MVETISLSVLLRVLQAVAAASPTILVGLLVAGLMRRVIGPAGVRMLFGVGTWRALPQAWLLGMLLPVCSLGVFPVAIECRRSGVTSGAVLAFALTAPLFNPLSLLYGLSLSEPLVVVSFALASLAVVSVVGGIWDWLLPETPLEAVESKPVSQGLLRMGTVGMVAIRHLSGWSGLSMLIGLLGVAILCSLLPPGSLGTSVESGDPGAIPTMTGVAPLSYATPLLAMSQIGSMFQHGNSIGAAFVLLALGAGINLGTFAWAIREFGLPRAGAFLLALTLVVVLCAYVLDATLHHDYLDGPGHTHAFDIFAQPNFAPSQAVEQFKTAVVEKISLTDFIALGILAGLAVAGIGLRIWDPDERTEQWLEQRPETEDEPAWHNRTLPGPLLGGIALAALVLFSVVGCYLYYPHAEAALAEISIIRTEVLSAAHLKDSEKIDIFAPLLEDWTRRMQVGVFLREGSLSNYRSAKAEVFLDKLERLKDELAELDAAEKDQLIFEVDLAYRRMRAAFQQP